MATLYSNEFQGCPAFLTHKTILVSPAVLAKHGIDCHQVTQKKGDIIITYPRAYHAGFNHGFNVAEAVNFATPRWVDEGKHFTECRCFHEAAVPITMEPFVRRSQDRSTILNWSLGTDYAPFPTSYAPYYLTDQDRKTIDCQKTFYLRKLASNFFK